MLDRYQEGIPTLIVNLVATTIVLNFYYDSPELAYLTVHEQCPEQGIILSEFTLVANEDSQDAAGPNHLMKPFNTLVQLGLKFFKGTGVAEVLLVIGIANNIPVGGMVPDQVILFFWQGACLDIPTSAEVPGCNMQCFAADTGLCRRLRHGPSLHLPKGQTHSGI